MLNSNGPVEGADLVAHLLKALHVESPEPCMAPCLARTHDIIPAQHKALHQAYFLHLPTIGGSLLVYTLSVHQPADKPATL